jgi:hypothetical protein
MVEALEQTDEKTLTPGGGDEGAAAPGGAEDAVAAQPAVLSADDFRFIGYTLNGMHWQADVSREIAMSKSQITRYLNGTRDIPPSLGIQMKEVILKRVLELTALLTLPGIPGGGTQDMKIVRDQITSAVMTAHGLKE